MPWVSKQCRHELFSQLAEWSEVKNLRKGRAIHARIVKSAVSSCERLGNSLVNLYAKCGDLRRARIVFHGVHRHDVVSWNCLIRASSSQAAMELLTQMKRENTSPNAHTFSGVISAAGLDCPDVHVIRHLHAAATKAVGFSDVFVGSSLLNLYCKAGLVFDAHNLFDEIPDRNVVCWATLISGYGKEKMAEEAVGIFGLLRREETEFDGEFVFTGVLSSLAVPGVLAAGRQIHCLAEKIGLLFFVPVTNATVTMYGKCGSLDDVIRVFEFSESKNAITWSAMVTGSALSGEPRAALKLFSRMHFSGMIPNEFSLAAAINACREEGKELHGYLIKLGFESHTYIASALVDNYAKSGSVVGARVAFNHSRSSRDNNLWASMIGGYVENGENEAALSLFSLMQTEGIAPDKPTLVSVLKACSSLAAMDQGKQIHGQAIKLGFGLEILIGTALSTMYAKSGNLRDGLSVFTRIPEKDLVSYNAMISGLSRNGRGEEALTLFEKMLSKGTEPDHVTFVNVLSSCSHAGLVEKARSFFDSMSREFGLEPKLEHYSCMVDVLSRAGKFREAKEFIESATIDHKIHLWRVLIGACRDYQSYRIGAYAGEKVIELGSREATDYVMLSRIYASLGKKEDVERVMGTMKARRVSKEPGCSWIESRGGGVNVFFAGDEAHPQIAEVYAEITRLRKNMTMQLMILVCGYNL